MKDRQLKIFFGISSLLLLVSLFLKLRKVPGGMILPGWFLGGMFVLAILVVSFVASFILKLFLKNLSYSTIYFITISVGLTWYHYFLYSPTLKIIVPEGYAGSVNLVLSKTNKNILVLDSNGIGYLNKYTFNKTYSKPIVLTETGKDITDQCVGFNQTTFFAHSRYCCINNKEIVSLEFEIILPGKTVQEPAYKRSRIEFVDTSKVLW